MTWTCALWLLLGLNVAACSHMKTHPQKEPESPSTLEQVADKRLHYEEALITLSSLRYGWISEGCDALLFSALFGAAEKEPTLFQVEKATHETAGVWERRPREFGVCFDEKAAGPQASSSSISKDMLLGLTYYAWRAQRKDIMQDLVAYGEAHSWVMGVPKDEIGKVVVTPSLAGLMYQVLYKLGGKDHPSRHIPDVYPSGLTGYEAHLQVTGILLRGEVDDAAGISDDMMARLKEHATRQPKNPFFATALAIYTGDIAPAIDLLTDHSQWPLDGLPSKANHCQTWVIQRDDGPDWLPCETDGEHTLFGADYVWTADLLTRPRRK